MDIILQGPVMDGHVHGRESSAYPDRPYSEFTAEDVLDDLGDAGVDVALLMGNLRRPLSTHQTFREYALSLQHKKNFGGAFANAHEYNLRELENIVSDTQIGHLCVGFKIYPESNNAENVTTSFSDARDGNLVGKQGMSDFSLKQGSSLCQIAELAIKSSRPITFHCEDPANKQQQLDRGAYGIELNTSETLFVANVIIPLAQNTPT